MREMDDGLFRLEIGKCLLNNTDGLIRISHMPINSGEHRKHIAVFVSRKIGQVEAAQSTIMSLLKGTYSCSNKLATIEGLAACHPVTDTLKVRSRFFAQLDFGSRIYCRHSFPIDD